MDRLGNIERELAAIGDLSREELVERWVKVYGCPPPKGVKRALLERSAAWHLQAKRLGGLSREARRVLRQSGKVGAAERTKRAGLKRNAAASMDDTLIAATKVAPLLGTRLLREWNGRSYIVDVVANGFVMDGKTYRSLSAIALRITGSHWSGPRFFGL